MMWCLFNIREDYYWWRTHTNWKSALEEAMIDDQSKIMDEDANHLYLKEKEDQTLSW